MKRLFLILMLTCCGFLYAETKTYKTGSMINFSMTEPNIEHSLELPQYKINAVIPYENGYLLKYIGKKDNCYYEIFITKGFTFYSYSYPEKNIVYYECKVIDVNPNEFTVDVKEMKKNKNQ